jgi:hypothetical protein
MWTAKAAESSSREVLRNHQSQSQGTRLEFGPGLSRRFSRANNMGLLMRIVAMERAIYEFAMNAMP